MEAAATARKYRKIAGICRLIKPKYEYTGEVYSIVVPSGVRDIMREGDALSHCVGKSDRYWERIEQQEAYILFLRKTAEIDKPYYTLEVEPNGTIRQKRTYFDRQNDDLKDAERFLKEWQKVVSERLTESDREKAERARSFACRNSSSCDRMTSVSIPATLPVSGWWMFWCRISWKLRPKPQHNTFEQRKGSYREHENGFTITQRNAVVEQHLWCIDTVMVQHAAWMQAAPIDPDDVYQSLAVRLIRAVNSYDPCKGYLKEYILSQLKREMVRVRSTQAVYGLTQAPANIGSTIVPLTIAAQRESYWETYIAV